MSRTGNWLSRRELVKTDRISGLAYEPAWLAGQIATVYLPWLFAAVMTKIHITRFKWLEALLLGLSGLLLLATFSRGGLLTAIGAIAFTFLLIGRDIMRSGWHWFVSGFKWSDHTVRRWLIAMSMRFGIILLIILAVVGAFFFLGQKDYFARLWSTQAEGLADFIIENSAGARAAYNWAGMGVYEEHPWLGVGLGASGFYMNDNLPDWALTTVPEIARQLNPLQPPVSEPEEYVRARIGGGRIAGFFVFHSPII